MRNSPAYWNSKSVDYGIHTTNDPLFLYLVNKIDVTIKELPFANSIENPRSRDIY